MSRSAVVITATVVALLASGAVLTLIYFGVAGVLRLGNGLDLMYVLWPASYMLTINWHTTTVGIANTIGLVLVNCVTYIAVALGLRELF